MADKRRKFDAEFREGAVRIVAETGRPVAQVAKDLGINETTLASWVSRAKRAGGDGTLSVPEREELARLRRQDMEKNKRIKELEMERDVLKRCMGAPRSSV
jgi:transposase